MAEQRLKWWTIFARVLLGVAFVALFLESISTTVHWWRGQLGAPTVIDWIEIGLLPVLLFVYLRYFSVLRPDCNACQPPQDPSRRDYPGV